jgi:hypothetical protein
MHGLSNAMTPEAHKILDEMFRAITEKTPDEIVEAATEAYTKWFDKNPKGNRLLAQKYFTKARSQKMEIALKAIADNPKEEPKVRLHARCVLAMGYGNGAFNGE